MSQQLHPLSGADLSTLIANRTKFSGSDAKGGPGHQEYDFNNVKTKYDLQSGPSYSPKGAYAGAGTNYGMNMGSGYSGPSIGPGYSRRGL